MRNTWYDIIPPTSIIIAVLSLETAQLVRALHLAPRTTAHSIYLVPGTWCQLFVCVLIIMNITDTGPGISLVPLLTC